MNHMQLMENAKIAIDKVFGDHSVPPSDTRESLQELMEEIEMKLETLKDA